MEQELSKKYSTTELFKLNLTDFLEEVKQDFLSKKYEGRLVVGDQILRAELENYLSRITNNFDDVDLFVDGIYIWEYLELYDSIEVKSSYYTGDLPMIAKLYTILLEKIESKFYNDTFEHLEEDSSYNSWIINQINPEYSYEGTYSCKFIDEHKFKGYKRAVEAFNSWEQDQERTKTETNNTEKQQKGLIENKPKYTPSELLENYHFWYKHSKEFREETQGYCNIFKNITETQFFEMIDNADFSMIINKHGYSKRVRYNIYVLSRKLDKEWGERAAKSINTTLDDCRKNSGFGEFAALKNMYLQ